MAKGKYMRLWPTIDQTKSAAYYLGLIAFFGLCATPALAVLISLSKTQNLTFGTFVANPAGSVTITPVGARNLIGVIGLSSTWLPAKFTVSGDAGTSYNISLPTTEMLSSGGNTMVLDNFTSTPSGSGVLSAGTETLYIGARLNVGSNQPAGNYTGSFTLTVVYQ